jgi:hypothetical protein
VGIVLITNGCVPQTVAVCGQALNEICGLQNPEDVAVIGLDELQTPVIDGVPPAGPFLLSVNGATNPIQGWFSLVDTSNKRAGTFPWLTAPQPNTFGIAGCAPPGLRRPRGFDVRLMPEGWWLIAVITDGADGARLTQRVEYVQLAHDDSGWVARWLGCVPVPDALFLNDVALSPAGGIYATHMFQRSEGWRAVWTRVRMFFGADTGFVVIWDNAKSWRPLANSQGAFPNGLAADPTGSVLFVAYTYNTAGNVKRFDLLSGTHKAADVPLRPDNFTWTADPVTKAHTLVTAGATGLRMLSTRDCESKKPACGFQFAVAAIDAASLSVQRLYADDRQASPGASVAAKLGETLYLGTAFGDRVTVVDLK